MYYQSATKNAGLGQKHYLHSNEGQVAMSRNLPPAPHRDVIERPLPLQTGEGALHGRGLQKGTPIRGLEQLEAKKKGVEERGVRSILPAYQRPSRVLPRMLSDRVPPASRRPRAHLPGSS